MAQSRTVDWQTAKTAEDSLIARFRAQRESRYGTGPLPGKRIGLAISGGGIRSATFNLGILEALRAAGILPFFDYVSTVSGGGYVGSWFASGALRHNNWLNSAADWAAPIRFLRRYSNYLSPRVGFFSADTWTMAAIWLRNTHLMQALVIAGMALLFAIVPWVAAGVATVIQSSIIHLVATVLLAIPAGIIVWGLIAKEGPEQSIVQIAVVSLLLFAILFSGTLVRDSPLIQQSGFRDHAPMQFAAGALGLGLAVTGILSRQRLRALAILSAAVATALFVVLCRQLANVIAEHPETARTIALVAGAPVLLLCLAAAITLLIGLEGREMQDRRREWWSRLGAWLVIYGLAWLAVTSCAMLAPDGVRTLWTKARTWLYSGGTAWIATTFASVMAAKSDKTGKKEERSTVSKILDVVAKIGPYVFIAGLATGVSMAVAAWAQSGIALAILAAVTSILAWRIDLNEFSLNHFYRNRLVRCYLGATRTETDRKPDQFTGFDFDDDLKLHDFADPARAYAGPMPIVNTAVNLGGSADLDVKNRRSASFFFTPAFCGSQRAHRPPEGEIEFAPTAKYPNQDGVGYGTVVSISGAAASPNSGFHTSSVVAFLMTVFNVRLGWWMPNPKQQNWYSGFGAAPRFGLSYLVKELFGSANERSAFVNLSDGGHFENLAIYELIRRECDLIVVGDGECDRKLEFGGLGNIVRMAEVDFGARIEIDVREIHAGTAHHAVGRIQYALGKTGTLIYLKSSMTGDEPIDVRQYKAESEDFPHETTGDQFFDEAQFESYRKLGRHVGSGAAAEVLAQIRGAAAGA